MKKISKEKIRSRRLKNLYCKRSTFRNKIDIKSKKRHIFQIKINIIGCQPRLTSQSQFDHYTTIYFDSNEKNSIGTNLL